MQSDELWPDPELGCCSLSNSQSARGDKKKSPETHSGLKHHTQWIQKAVPCQQLRDKNWGDKIRKECPAIVNIRTATVEGVTEGVVVPETAALMATVCGDGSYIPSLDYWIASGLLASPLHPSGKWNVLTLIPFPLPAGYWLAGGQHSSASVLHWVRFPLWSRRCQRPCWNYEEKRWAVPSEFSRHLYLWYQAGLPFCAYPCATAGTTQHHTHICCHQPFLWLLWGEKGQRTKRVWGSLRIDQFWTATKASRKLGCSDFCWQEGKSVLIFLLNAANRTTLSGQKKRLPLAAVWKGLVPKSLLKRAWLTFPGSDWSPHFNGDTEF